jgi:hypothetical protein
MTRTITRPALAFFMFLLVVSPLSAAQQQDTAKSTPVIQPAHDTSKVTELPDAKVADTLEQDSITGWFVIETRHRMYANFLQIDTVAFGQPFQIGEEDVRARVVRFNPHLAVGETGKIHQMSDTLINPAVHIRVVQGGKVTQESWAFTNMAPHFRKDNFFGFKLIGFRVDEKRYINPPEQQKQ